MPLLLPRSTWKTQDLSLLFLFSSHPFESAPPLTFCPLSHFFFFFCHDSSSHMTLSTGMTTITHIHWAALTFTAAKHHLLSREPVQKIFMRYKDYPPSPNIPGIFLTQPQWKQGSRLHNVKPPQQGELQALQLETNGSRRREKHQICARHPHSRLDMSRLPQPTGQLSLTEMKQDIKITFPEYSNIHLPRVANPCRFTLTSSVQSENCVTPPDCMKSMPTVS